MFTLQKYMPRQGTRLLFCHILPCHSQNICHSTTYGAWAYNFYKRKNGLFLQREHSLYYLCLYTPNSKIRDMKENSSIIELFFHLIRCGIGKQRELPYTPSHDEWQELFEIAKKQTLVGIVFAAAEQLPPQQRPPKETILQLFTLCENIKKQNSELDKKCAIVSAKFKSEGFDNCILKGQGIAQLYPNPSLRTPGDIDIWLGGSDKKIIEYVRKHIPDSLPTYHHIDFPILPGLEIEAHYRPSWLYNPITNRRLQRYFETVAQEQFGNEITTANGSFPVPTVAFNRIYILLHIYRHLFQEGIGLRQLLDYYFVLDHGFSQEEREECAMRLKEFGLEKFAAATTYILQEKFGLEREKHIVPSDSKRGEFLLNEVMTAGNFGQYDTRYSIVSKENEFAHFLNSMKRIARLIFQYPGETLWSPYFKIWHYFWRKRH